MSDIQITGVQLLDASGTTFAAFQAARADGHYGTGINTRMDRRRFGTLEGDGQIDLVVDSGELRPGGYVLSVGVLDAHTGRTLDVHHRAYQFSIAPHTSTHGPGLVDRDWHDRQLATARLATKKERFP